jgi:hypothetical protein
MLCLHAQEYHLYIHRIPCDHLHRSACVLKILYDVPYHYYRVEFLGYRYLLSGFYK